MTESINFSTAPPVDDQPMIAERKSKVVAALLCFFFGWLGGHKFYLGFPKLGVIYLAIGLGLQILLFAVNPLFFLGQLVFSIWLIIETVLICVSKPGSRWNTDSAGNTVR